MKTIARSFLFRYPIIFIITFLPVFSLTGPAFGQGDEIAVSCYAGTPDTYDEVGTIAVWDPLNRAVGLCNMEYRDCYARCWACWIDPDSGSEVCRDLSGRLFNRS